MSGRLIVDDADVYASYGMYVVAGGWNELVAWPSLKSVNYNDWFEENGIQPDLSAPKLDEKTFSIRFSVTSKDGYTSFISMLASKPYHTFKCNEIGRSYKLRLVQSSSLDNIDVLGTATIKFADDFPLDGYSYQSPSKTVSFVSNTSCSIDARQLSEYNAMLLKGSVSDVVRKPAVKEALKRNVSTVKGVIYDEDAPVKMKSKDVKLQCLMRADSLDNLWRNYFALLYDLTRPSARSLSVGGAGTYSCFYKSSSVSEFYPTGRVWLKFIINLTFIDGK